MTLLGAGLAFAGSSPAGLGTLIESSGCGAPIFIKSDGSQGAAPAIDPTTGDYLLDSRGREVGSDATPMKVQLALLTALDSTAVKGFGFDLQIQSFRPDTAVRIQAAVASALSDLTSAKLISLQSVTFTRKDQTAYIRVKWIDLQTATLQTTELNVH